VRKQGLAFRQLFTISRQKCEEEFETPSGFWQIGDYWVTSFGFSWHRLLRRSVRRPVFMAAFYGLNQSGS
jgi:hypothetical protein